MSTLGRAPTSHEATRKRMKSRLVWFCGSRLICPVTEGCFRQLFVPVSAREFALDLPQGFCI